MTITEAEVKLICCLDALPAAVGGANFAAFETLVESLADDKADQLLIARKIVLQTKEGITNAKTPILDDVGGTDNSGGIFMVRGGG